MRPRHTIARQRSCRPRLTAALPTLAFLIAVVSGCGTTTDEPEQKRRAAGPHAARTAAQDEPTPTVTTVGDTVVATAVDRQRGLKFEVESSTVFGDTGLRVTLIDDAPAETQRLVRASPLVATCEMPGRHVGESAGYWDDRFDQFGTALTLDPTPRPAAQLVTSCQLWIGEPGGHPETAIFPDAAFSTVRFA